MHLVIAPRLALVFLGLLIVPLHQSSPRATSDEGKAISELLSAESDADRLEALDRILKLPHSSRLFNVVLVELTRGLHQPDLTRSGEAYYFRVAKYLWGYKENRGQVFGFVRTTEGSRVRAYIITAAGESKDRSFAAPLLACALAEVSEGGELGAINSALAAIAGSRLFKFSVLDGKQEFLHYWLDELCSKRLIPE